MTIGCYILTNKTTHKRYVGQSACIEQRLGDHRASRTKSLIHKSVRKHGFDNFSIRIWECPEYDLDELEEFLISELCTKNPDGYNLTEGGGGTRGAIKTPELRARLSKANLGKAPANKGVSPTEEQKAKRAATIAANPRKLKPKRIRLTQEQQKQYQAYITKGANHPQFGKPKSEETREKIRQTLIGNTPWNKGKKNAQAAWNKGKSKKTYLVTRPDGVQERVTCLPEYCRQNDLDDSKMYLVANGAYKQHKQFKCEVLA